MSKKINNYESLAWGPIQVERNGRMISIKNNATTEEYNNFIDGLANGYESYVQEINNLINEIKQYISKCNPLELLKYAYHNFFMSILGITSEVQQTKEQVYMGREIEYIQSVLVSSESYYDFSVPPNDDSKTFYCISEKIQKLYTLVERYCIFHTAKIKKEKNIELDLEKEKFLVEAQLSVFVRGDRYSVYEIPTIRTLLQPHNDEFIKQYNISVDDFVKGLESIKKSLTHGVMDTMGILNLLHEDFKTSMREETGDIREKYNNHIEADEKLSERKEKFIENFCGYGLFDLTKLTNWPKKLLEDLSFSLNENKRFYENDLYGGWPLIELPVYERPFINVNDSFYCFDYYNLFDNIYRVIQKLIKRVDLLYAQKWNKRQMEITESMVGDLFKKVLPGCTLYESNYYPKNKSLKDCAENDLIVIYDDNIIIVEVKGGSYTYRSPILDIESHIKSLETLVGVADSQAERTLTYLKSAENVKLYDSKKKEKCNISINDFEEVTLMCVTLDNFNEFAAKIEKLNFMSLNKNTIALSIDDFRVYTDYFDSPLTFLHYLKERKLATRNKALNLNDELDHLGMYIKHNIYSDMYSNENYNYVNMYGYREEIDKYFNSLDNESIHIDKPVQNIPGEFLEIINFLDKSKLVGRRKLSSFLLNFAEDAKFQLVEGIKTMLKRQKEINRMTQLSLMGEIPMSLFCHQPSICDMPEEECREYTMATMLKAKDKFRLELHLFYDNNNVLIDLKFKFHQYEDIPDEQIGQLKQVGDKIVLSRIENFKKVKGKKIGRNDPCPCGSGKKYKKCCGK